MSREACSFCGRVVSTTADPNTREGYFVNLVDCEKLEMEIGEGLDYPRGWFRKNCLRLVICDECRKAMRRVRLTVCASALESYAAHDVDTGEFLGYADERGYLAFGPKGHTDPIRPPEKLEVWEREDCSGRMVKE